MGDWKHKVCGKCPHLGKMLVTWLFVPRKRPNKKLKSYLQTCTLYKRWEFNKNCANKSPWGTNLYKPSSMQWHHNCFENYTASLHFCYHKLLNSKAWQRNKEINITFFVYSRRTTHDLHHTWHGDRGGQCHFLQPLTFSDLIGSSVARSYWNLWENTPNM